MSIAIISELHAEVRRLFIAGSGLASNDPRLSKLAPQLAKLGESSPVFKRLAESVSQVISASGDKTAVPLLELGSLLHSIMYTQGKSGVTGEGRPVQALGCAAAAAAAPYRKLAPLLEALRTKGSGRLAVIRSGAEDGLFQDFRTYLPAVAALEDVPEIADYLEEHVMPGIGKPIIPILEREFNLEGGKGDGRKLRVLHALAGEAVLHLLERAAREGALEVRIAAIQLLAGYPQYLELLLEQSSDGKKEVRRAAYTALASLTGDKVVDRLFDAFKGKDQEAAVEAVRACGDERLTGRVVAYVHEQLRDLDSWTAAANEAEGEEKTKAAKKRDNAGSHIGQGLEALRGKKGLPIYELLCELQLSESFAAYARGYLKEYPAQMLLDLQLPEADWFVLELKERYGERLIGYSLVAATRTLPPQELYDRFAPELKKSSSAQAKLLAHTLVEILPGPAGLIWGGDNEGQERAARYGVRWAEQLPEALRDPRWLKALVAAGQSAAVASFLPFFPDDEEAVTYAADKLASMELSTVSVDHANELLYALLIAGYKRVPEALLHMMVNRPYYFAMHDRFIDLLKLLPAAYEQQAREKASQMGSSYERYFAQAIEQIKQNDYAEIPAHKGAERIAWLKNKLLR